MFYSFRFSTGGIVMGKWRVFALSVSPRWRISSEDVILYVFSI